MPIALDPQDKRLCWLASDADKPLASRPVFECVAGSRGLKRKHDALRESVSAMDDETFYTSVVDGILLGVTGWRNCGDKPFSREALEDLLEDHELLELFRTWPNASRMTEEDAKNSVPLVPSEPGAPAPTAQAETATPTNTSPT